MVKKTIFSLLLALLVVNCMAQEYILRINVEHRKGSKIMLTYYKGSELVMDTNAVVSGNSLVFKGRVEQPVVAALIVQKPGLDIETGDGVIPAPELQFFLTNDQINIKGDADKIYLASVQGGKPNEEWNDIKLQVAGLTGENWEALKNAYVLAAKGDSSGMKKYQELSEANSLKSNKLNVEFISKYPKSLVSMMLLFTQVNKLTVGELELAFNKLDNSSKHTIWAKGISEKINASKATAIGQKAADFNKKDKDGRVINLSSLRGKYVLLDFWGSWCAPCRQNNPHLKKLYQTYKDRGFEILGIAYEQGRTLDEERKSWLEAVKADEIDWIQILNNEDIDQSDLVKIYGVTAFPTKILLDQEGRIIARYTGDGNELDTKLAELIK